VEAARERARVHRGVHRSRGPARPAGAPRLRRSRKRGAL
jgi:hypothetical protein